MTLSDEPHYQFETKRPGELTEAKIVAWARALDDAVDCDSAFYSYTFAKAAQDVGFDVHVTTACNGAGELAGLFAFQKNPGLEGGLGLGQRVGGEMSDYSGPLLAKQPAGTLSPSDFFEASGLKRFEIDHVPGGPPGGGEDLVDAPGGPVTSMASGFDEWWARFSEERKSRATDLARRRRKIEREYGDLRFVLEVDKTDELLDKIIDEKCRQYRERGATDVFENAQNRKLLHQLSREDHRQCTLVLSTLYAGETWAAFHIGLRCGPVFHYWFPVFNDDLKRMSPGRLLILEMLRAMPGGGMNLLDYGLGESRTKLEFANGTRRFVKGSWSAAGVGGLVARSFQSLKWRLG